jgi:hypothetical protein
MLYSFSGPSEIINDNLAVKSEEELAFVYLTAALCEKADLKIENINSEALAAVYEDAGIQSNFYDNRLYITKKPLHINGTLIKDFSEHAHLAIPFAIVCAAKGIQADLKGLETLVKEKGTAVAMFQKEIYRFHINTDFCDHSKLKIFNNKGIKQKTKPVKVSSDDTLTMNFIPLATFFKNMEIELAEDFFERNGELAALLASLNFSYNKI